LILKLIKKIIYEKKRAAKNWKRISYGEELVETERIV
jgi:hypothetical protein